MKNFVPVMIVFVMLLASGTAMGGEDSAASLTAFYQAAIDMEIASCLNKQSLQDSRSIELQRKGHHEASKAQFLMTHRDRLIKDMLSSDLGRKDYKIQRFMNDRFHYTCYAHWQARSSK